MFTGIVDHCGEILSLSDIPKGIRLQISTDFEDLILGESIAIDGICLTVTEILPKSFCCEISPETCAVTTAKNFTINSRVNVERALKASDRFGGHIVLGHVDAVGVISLKENQGDFLKVHIQHHNLSAYFMKKGSVAVNGVSLTINETAQDRIEVMLIPHTLSRTNLGQLEINHPVNIECDYLAKMMINHINAMMEKNET